MLSATDGMGGVTRYVYDDVGRSIKVTTPEGVTVTTNKTRNGQTLSVIDGNTNAAGGTNTAVQYLYDKDGQLKQVTDALGHVVSSDNYDSAGRLIQTTDARGIVTTLSYDGANRVLTRVVDPSTVSPAHTGLNLTTTYTYTALGQQLTVADPAGLVTKYAYDKLGQVITVTVDPTVGSHSGLNPSPATDTTAWATRRE